MSEYDEQVDSNDSICPYCGGSFQVETEDYSEDTSVVECYDCGKKYYLHQSFEVNHHTRPDCELNDTPHKYEPIEVRGRGLVPFCSVCGTCQPISERCTAPAEP